MRRAVIDVGSNSVLLTVAELMADGWHPIFESSDVTALGERVKVTGLLQPDAMARTLSAIKTAYDEANRHGAEEISCAATMAARIATNASEFVALAEKQGTPITIISGEIEANLGLRAVVDDPKFQKLDLITVIDPGGHSTELTTAKKSTTGSREICFSRSFPVGTLGLQSGVLAAECPDGLARLHACKHIDDLLGLEYRPHMCGTVVTLGATGTNLISIREKMGDWNPDAVHGQWLDYEEVSKAAAWLAEMPLAERANVVGMEPGREKTLHSGALILERFLFACHALGCYVSVRGWRHAVFTYGLEPETFLYPATGATNGF